MTNTTNNDDARRAHELTINRVCGMCGTAGGGNDDCLRCYSWKPYTAAMIAGAREHAERADAERDTAAAAEELRLEELRALGRPVRVAVLGCGKSKLDRPAPARELYTGNLFRAGLEHVEAELELGTFDDAVILSGLEGLVELDTELKPYNYTPTKRAELERLEAKLARELVSRYHELEVELVVFAGVRYVGALEGAARAIAGSRRVHGVPNAERIAVEAPLAGLMVGERLRWYKAEATAREALDVCEECRGNLDADGFCITEPAHTFPAPTLEEIEAHDAELADKRAAAGLEACADCGEVCAGLEAEHGNTRFDPELGEPVPVCDVCVGKPLTLADLEAFRARCMAATCPDDDPELVGGTDAELAERLEVASELDELEATEPSPRAGVDTVSGGVAELHIGGQRFDLSAGPEWPPRFDVPPAPFVELEFEFDKRALEELTAAIHFGELTRPPGDLTGAPYPPPLDWYADCSCRTCAGARAARYPGTQGGTP